MSKTQAHVMIVEDERATADVIAFNLESRGYSTDICLDGDEALRKLVEKRPDLMILDINMPGVSGWEVLDLLPNDEDLASVPVIILSGRDTSVDITTGWNYEIVTYFTKPFEMRELLEFVDRVLRGEGDDEGEADAS